MRGLFAAKREEPVRVTESVMQISRSYPEPGRYTVSSSSLGESSKVAFIEGRSMESGVQ